MASCIILAAEARSEGKVTSGDFGGERQRTHMLLISEGEKGGVNAKDRWIGLNHVYFMSVFYVWEAFLLIPYSREKFVFLIRYRCLNQINMLIGVEVNAYPKVRHQSVCGAMGKK